uniref:SGNH/GDSL hydrolase family protein n=1 Tax=uncultured Bdellovibrionales bacterium TaxID=395355 RepID=A0A977XMB6_9BACT|nr:SGNH/GDSL hydrolase family protein [uncultured Bdellovibrionales bacterium]
MWSKLKNLSVIAASILVGFLIFEAIFGGWFTSDPWFQATSMNILRNVNITYKVDTLGIEQAISDYKRDQYGLRGTCTNKNLATMITIGGSTTDQRYTAEGATWQDVLQKNIQETLSLPKFCIANAGVDGHSTFGHLASFDIWFRNIPSFKPEFLLFYVGINDAAFRFEKAFNDQNIQFRSYRNSVLYRIYKIFDTQRISDSQPQFAGHRLIIKNPVLYSETKLTENAEILALQNAFDFRLRMSEILRRTVALGAKPICVSQPHALSWNFGGQEKGVRNAFFYKNNYYNGLDYNFSLSLINQAMAELCVQYGGFYLNLRDKKFSLLDFYDYVHTTPQGAKKIADYLMQEINAQKILEFYKLKMNGS